MRSALAALLLAITFAGCKKDQPVAAPPQPKTVEEKLAQRAVEEPSAPTELVGDAGVPTARERTFRDVEPSDPVSLTVRSVATQQRVDGAKIAITTQDVFLSVELVLLNAGQDTHSVNFQGVKLVADSGEEYAIASDAQSLAGRRDLVVAIGPEERQLVKLWFEVPEASVKGGLNLRLPAADGRKELVLTLQ